MGRSVAAICSACAAALLVLALAVVAHADYRSQSEARLQRISGASARMARSVSGQLDAAETVLRTAADSVREGLLPRSGLRRQLTQTGPFSWAAILEPGPDGSFNAMQRRMQVTAQEQLALENGRSVAVTGESPAGPRVYLVRRVSELSENHVLVAELAPEWLWRPLERADLTLQVLVIDGQGTEFFGNVGGADYIRGLFSGMMAARGVSKPTQPLAWQNDGAAWVGALSPVPPSASVVVRPLGIVIAGPEIAWYSQISSALHTLLPVILAALLLVALAVMLIARRYVPPLRELQRALLQLPDSRTALPRPGAAFPELRQLADAFNQTAERVERQRRMLQALNDIDTFLIGVVEVENVLDCVLQRMRELMQSRNVGLLLIDANAPDLGRLFSVSAEGGLPISRMGLDPQMAQTLLESRAGLTIMRCEEERHSFLAPLHAAGAQFFWTWPIVVGERLAAILAVGYVEPPQQQGAQLAHYGTQCARRMSAALAISARSEELYRQAYFDPLTQLPNRLLFRDRLEQELSGLAENATRGALLYIDLDHFKRVNDSMGHEAGDQLLAIIAQRLRSCVKDGDTVARLAGDEFTVILRQVVEPGAVAAVADRIIQSLQMPVNIGGKDHQVRASIGVTLFPDDGATLDELLRNADLAMYQAKARGRGAAAFYEPKLAQRVPPVADSGLYRALKRREFALLYQPQYSVRDGSLQGIEALLRWQTPRDGVRTPVEFIAAAEESGLIIDLGGWVLETACQQIARWRNDGLEVPRVAVNVSVQQLRDPAFSATLRRLLDRYQIPAGILELELTEAALSDPDAQDSVAAISGMGVGLILDDFGTGHTALNNLRRYPVRVVKIDRSFVGKVTDDAGARALADTIIVMAHALGKKVVAEGVETVEQLDFLRERSCDIAQGYYLARPLTAVVATELLMRRAGDGDPGEQVARA
ncbi:MAG: EAL domain-containing protein [Steroidobacteraceae bacterium]